MGRTATTYVPNNEVNVVVLYNAVLRDDQYLVSLSKSNKNKSMFIIEHLNIPVVCEPDAEDDADDYTGGEDDDEGEDHRVLYAFYRTIFTSDFV
jgi:hypothetical protein